MPVAGLGVVTDEVVVPGVGTVSGVVVGTVGGGPEFGDLCVPRASMKPRMNRFGDRVVVASRTFGSNVVSGAVTSGAGTLVAASVTPTNDVTERRESQSDDARRARNRLGHDGKGIPAS